VGLGVTDGKCLQKASSASGFSAILPAAAVWVVRGRASLMGVQLADFVTDVGVGIEYGTLTPVGWPSCISALTVQCKSTCSSLLIFE